MYSKLRVLLGTALFLSFGTAKSMKIDDIGDVFDKEEAVMQIFNDPNRRFSHLPKDILESCIMPCVLFLKRIVRH